MGMQAANILFNHLGKKSNYISNDKIIVKSELIEILQNCRCRYDGLFNRFIHWQFLRFMFLWIDKNGS
jgi:hypothetical protein